MRAVASQVLNSAPCVDDDRVAVFRDEFETRRIAAVFEIFSPRDRNGSPCAPTSDDHDKPSRFWFKRSISSLPIPERVSKRIFGPIKLKTSFLPHRGIPEVLICFRFHAHSIPGYCGTRHKVNAVFCEWQVSCQLGERGR